MGVLELSNSVQQGFRQELAKFYLIHPAELLPSSRKGHRRHRGHRAVFNLNIMDVLNTMS